MKGLDKRSDYHIWKILNPRNGHHYLLVCDNASASCHITIGPRKVWINGISIRKLITNKDITKFKEMRKSDEIKTQIRYEL